MSDEPLALLPPPSFLYAVERSFWPSVPGTWLAKSPDISTCLSAAHLDPTVHPVQKTQRCHLMQKQLMQRAGVICMENHLEMGFVSLFAY